MGAGQPSAMAAAILHPEKKGVTVYGDGGFMINSQELETAVPLKLNLTILVLNDKALGMMKWKQNLSGFEKFGLNVGNPNFLAYVCSYGVKGYRVTSAAEFSDHLHDSLPLSQSRGSKAC